VDRGRDAVAGEEDEIRGFELRPFFYDILFLRSTISDVYKKSMHQTIYENGPIQLTEIVTGR
jgi:hypothetical protein